VAKTKRKGKRQRLSSSYRRLVRRADRVLEENDVDLRPDNWQQVVLDWLEPAGPDQDTLAAFMAAHETELGLPWAREMLRLEVFFQADDYEQIIAHYERGLSRYPRCGLVELWAADNVFRRAGDYWRARGMYCFAMEQMPDHPKPYYEVGFMHYLLGDFPGALDWFNQAADRVEADDAMLGSVIYYNRALVRYVVEGDRKAALADIREALRRRPDYAQAKVARQALRRGELRWIP